MKEKKEQNKMCDCAKANQQNQAMGMAKEDSLLNRLRRKNAHAMKEQDTAKRAIIFLEAHPEFEEFMKLDNEGVFYTDDISQTN